MYVLVWYRFRRMRKLLGKLPVSKCFHLLLPVSKWLHAKLLRGKERMKKKEENQMNKVENLILYLDRQYGWGARHVLVGAVGEAPTAIGPLSKLANIEAVTECVPSPSHWIEWFL